MHWLPRNLQDVSYRHRDNTDNQTYRGRQADRQTDRQTVTNTEFFTPSSTTSKSLVSPYPPHLSSSNHLPMPLSPNFSKHTKHVSMNNWASEWLAQWRRHITGQKLNPTSQSTPITPFFVIFSGACSSESLGRCIHISTINYYHKFPRCGCVGYSVVVLWFIHQMHFCPDLHTTIQGVQNMISIRTWACPIFVRHGTQQTQKHSLRRLWEEYQKETDSLMHIAHT